MNGPNRTLVILLRVVGVLASTPVFPIFMPTNWMAASPEWLGLGEARRPMSFD
jgi:hypothetical protein